MSTSGLGLKGLLASLAFLSLACRTTAPGSAGESLPRAAASPSVSTSPAKNSAECARCNGVWGRHGLAQTDGCNCRTGDAGKVCRQAEDCQGQCVLKDPPDTETLTAGPPATGHFLGRCSEFETVFGCSRFLGKGAAHAPVNLAEVPPALCVD